MVTLSRKLLLIFICFLSNIHGYKYTDQFSGMWPNWWESGEKTVRMLDSVPSLIPGWTLDFFQLSQP